MKTEFGHITEWIFDLDNTLYPRHCDLFSQIDIKMTEYVMELLDLQFEDARKIQKELYRDHGTTLNGLIKKHRINPHGFLEKVHDIDYSELPADLELNELIKALPGRKYIFTNGDVPHALRTLEQLQIENVFDGIFDIVAADFEPKPACTPYSTFIEKYDINPQKAAMFEDMPRNLFVPNNYGIKTVLITPKASSSFALETWEVTSDDNSFIDHRTDDLNAFLKTIAG